MGGGCKGVEVEVFETSPIGAMAMVVLHLLVDVRDAMGANTVNTMAEHARNIAITAGATGTDVERVAKAIVASGDVSVNKAKQVLETT